MADHQGGVLEGFALRDGHWYPGPPMISDFRSQRCAAPAAPGSRASGALPTRPLWLLGALALALSNWPFRNGAEAQSGIAGNYASAPQKLEATVSAWGEDCGPRPQSQTFDEQVTVKVSEEGAHLVLKYPDRTLRTNGCWSPNVAMKLISATSANGRYRAECRTAQGDAKKETGRYTVTSSNGKLELVEESEYDWQLKSSHCEAKVRMTQTLSYGDKPAVVLDAAVPDAAPVAEQADPTSACVPGAAARIRVRPSEARVGPGERVCFTVRAFDAAGCGKDLAPSAVDFSLAKPNGAEATLSGACFKAAGNAALAEGIFRVSASSGGLRDQASVSVSAVDLSDITARRGPSGSSPLGPTIPNNETVFESGVRAVSSGSHGLLWLSLSLAGVAAVLSGIAFMALRLTRRRAASAALLASQRPPRPSRGDAPIVTPPPASAAPPAKPPRQDGPQRICPRCRRGYAPFTERCATDNEPLLDYADFLKRSEQQAAPRSCPKCGEALASDAVFCGRCGHKTGS